MEPQLVYLLQSQTSIMEASTSTWSFIKVFSSITIPSDLEFVLQDFVVSAKLNDVTEGESVAHVEILDPDGESIGSLDLKGPLTAGEADVSANFSQVRLSKLGRHHIKLALNGKVLSDDRHYFTVKK